LRGPSGRLVSIDALRGIAALGVLVFHAAQRALIVEVPGLPDLLGRGFALLMSFGYVGVWLFFVISGFCIHLRWAKSRVAGAEPRVDFIAFWKRRIARLYPAYIIALILYVSLLVFTGNWVGSPFRLWDLGLHLVMLHNFDVRTSYSFNGVFWTLAIEEQLYLAYFALVPMRRSLGWTKTLAVCLGARMVWFAAAFTLHRLFLIELPVTEAAASNWFPWALGALSLEARLDLIRLPSWCRNLGVSIAVLLTAGTLAYMDRSLSPYGNAHRTAWLIVDPVWGVGFFILLNWVTGFESRWKMKKTIPRLLVWLSSVGIVSYSLYLTHELLLTYLVGALKIYFSWSRNTTILYSVLVFSPLSVLFAWSYFQVFERPFLRAKTPNG
jgi:peptidoglycan/LPS O-acetylase OafA/YrhL